MEDRKIMSNEAYREIIKRLLKLPNPTARDLSLIKMQVAEELELKEIPPNSLIIGQLSAQEKRRLLPILVRKKVRAASGVTVIAVMTQPSPCPKASPCAYCPGGPKVGVPQSYTGFEPATMRGIQNRFSPYRQVRSRIEQLESIGHEVDKVELIIMGGTFPSTPKTYQTRFIQRCLDALAGQKSNSLEEAKKKAETSPIRNVGITVETRPDWARQSHVDAMLSMGVTRAELGVQNVYDDIYELVNREHTVQDVIEATKILKDSGLKVAYHMMPGLPGSNPKRDFEGFQTIFADSHFKPDMIKIYPCLVIKGTEAYRWWQKGEYNPYTTEEAVDLIAKVKQIVPPWVRIMRVQRDIPAYLIEAGAKSGNLRELAQQRLREQNLRCRCIRCREVGHRWLKEKVKPNPENVKIAKMHENASDGEEIFVSAEDSINDILLGYLRLRIPSKEAGRPEISNEPCSIVRELHVYGPLVPVGKKARKAWQHKGYGGLLLSEAERISRERYDRRKVLVTSALGTKRYYKRFGYDYDGPYMSKHLGS